VLSRRGNGERSESVSDDIRQVAAAAVQLLWVGRVHYTAANWRRRRSMQLAAAPFPACNAPQWNAHYTGEQQQAAGHDERPRVRLCDVIQRTCSAAQHRK